MIGWIKRKWPLCWKATLEREKRFEASNADHYRKQASRLQDDLRKAEHRNTRWQRQITEMMSHADRDWYTRRLLSIAQPGVSMIACFHPPKVQLFGRNFDDKIDFSTAASREEVRLIRIGFDLGLSKRTPPELVTREVLEAVETEILRVWQDQSILDVELKGN